MGKQKWESRASTLQRKAERRTKAARVPVSFDQILVNLGRGPVTR